MMKKVLFLMLLLFGAHYTFSVTKTEKVYPVFQFPQTAIPRIDGDFSDWEPVPESYTIGLSELYDTHGGRGANLDPEEFDLNVKVAWVNGLNRLYFYIRAYDDCWDFEDTSLRQDIFELVIDADLSGGPFIKEDNGHRNMLSVEKLHFKGHGAHAQNYHIFTPAQAGKEWAMVWGSTPWIKDFPYANVACKHAFKQGESGVLEMEFWITPFDHAAVEGISRSVVSELKENELIAMSWCMIDFDTGKPKADPVMCLSHDFRMIRDASFLNAFRLMPMEKAYARPVAANWSFIELNREERTIQFLDQSKGDITDYQWDFGDGATSNEKDPVHRYAKSGEWIVKLTVEGPEGKDTRIKVWEVVTE